MDKHEIEALIILMKCEARGVPYAWAVPDDEGGSLGMYQDGGGYIPRGIVHTLCARGYVVVVEPPTAALKPVVLLTDKGRGVAVLQWAQLYGGNNPYIQALHAAKAVRRRLLLD